MDKHTRRRHEAQKRALNVATENRAPIEASQGGTKALADLTAQVTDVDSLSAEQSSWLNEMRKAFKRCAELRHTLHGVLKAVVQLSTSVVLEKDTAELMKLPRRANDGQFLDDARAIRNGVVANRQPFLDAGLPPHVLVDLPAQIDAFAAAKEKARSAREHIGLIVQDIVQRLGDGDKAIDVIEAILATSADADPNAVKHLRLAKRVGPSQTKPAAPEAPAAEPATKTA